jgi:hypothetical protein
LVHPFLPAIREIMTEFADLTGLSAAAEIPRRYLWTDAFAVCNFFELFGQTREGQYRDLALRLVDQVHNILGRHRKDDSRTGWISGLDEKEGRLHPTKGGLRIGKELNERHRDDPVDERLEWDRDGQYFHYLTKWMHALHQVSRATEKVTYNRWAIELAKTVHARFTYRPSARGQKRMYWKMSIDLSRPLVPSMGHLDPLDGLITYNELQAAATEDPEKSTGLDLSAEIADLAAICEGRDWETDDPLGIGDLLTDAYRLAQLARGGNFEGNDLLARMLDSSRMGLESYLRKKPLGHAAHNRLPFREFGLSVGLHALERLRAFMEQNPGFFRRNGPLASRVEDLLRYSPLAETIEEFWLESLNRKAGTWGEHRHINAVMLATSLAPDTYLTLQPL